MSSAVAGTCEVDVFEDHGNCDQPGDVLYHEPGTGQVLLCLDHAKEIAGGVPVRELQ